MVSQESIKGIAEMATEDTTWRTEVSTRIQESALANQNTAIALERILGKLDLHDQRLKALENVPANQRANLTVAVAIAGLIMTGLACAIGPFLGAMAAYLIQLFAGK
jgi:hypothetical protein